MSTNVKPPILDATGKETDVRELAQWRQYIRRQFVSTGADLIDLQGDIVSLQAQINALSGRYVKSAEGTNATTTSGLTTTIPNDNTIPQSSEGSQIVSLAYTPIAATNLLRITADLEGWTGIDDSGGNSAILGIVALFSSLSTDAIATSITSFPASLTGISNTVTVGSTRLVAYITASTLTSVQLRAGAISITGTGTWSYNSGQRLGGVVYSSIKVEEISV